MRLRELFMAGKGRESNPRAAKTSAGRIFSKGCGGDATFTLDVQDSEILKGIAILVIAFHNYFHKLSLAKENEFEFHPERIFVFLRAVRDPHESLQALISFFGHYGVQIFVFLSAYGLAKKYWNHAPGWAGFVWGRVRKLYPLFIAVMVLWVLVVGLAKGPTGPWQMIHAHGAALAATLLGILNLVPGHSLPPVGPWWFMPFIVQFYCLWPLLKRFAERFGAEGLLVLSAAALLLIASANDFLIAHCSLTLTLSPLGSLPVICLGIAMARYNFNPGRGCTALAVLAFLPSNFFAWLWPLGAPATVVLALRAYRFARPALRRLDILRRAGLCSPALFLVNGVTRIPFLDIAWKERNWYAELLLGLAAVCVAWLSAELLTVGIGGPKHKTVEQILGFQGRGA
ncbi:MAG TPA: acyltransferase [Bryobacteraceae bacterium]